jgi:predicted nucleic acid-binding protein
VSYLLDTNVISELRRKEPDPRLLDWYYSVPSGQLFVSVLTIGEIRLGIERLRRKDLARADALERWLRGLRGNYQDRIIDIDIETAQEWGRMNVPDPLPVIDGMLAATAKVRGWTLVTRNIADVASSEVALLNPFDRPA